MSKRDDTDEKEFTSLKLLNLTTEFRKLNNKTSKLRDGIRTLNKDVDEIKRNNIEIRKQQSICDKNLDKISRIGSMDTLTDQNEKKLSQLRNSNMKKLIAIAKKEKIDSCAIDEEERKLEKLVTHKDVLTRRELYINEKSTNGSYTWKICDIISKLTEGADQDYNSLPFFLSPQGYKFRISMYRNLAYLAIKIICMKSPMDPLMAWPIRIQAEISLINSTNRSKSLTKCFKIEVLEDPSNVLDEQVIAIDEKKFLPMDQIFQYVIKDCIFLFCCISNCSVVKDF